MQKNPPSVGRLLVMSVFALSCVGIVLYLWLTFGGSVPLKPEGYRVHVKFPEGTTLAQEAEVRLAGVKVGSVKTKELSGEALDAELEIEEAYAPIPADSRAILRQKTLLGETYVELSPGTKGGETIKDNGDLGPGQVSPTVELDEIFQAFDGKTRRAFQRWLDNQGRAFDNRGEDLNDALGNLAPFAEDANDVLAILNEQDAATRGLVRDTGVVFEALTERGGQLRDLIENSNRVFETTARRDQQLADTFRVFPTFLDESRVTMERLSEFAVATNPLITQLRPAARELSPTLIQLRGLAPDLKGLFRDLGPLITASRRGLPALERYLEDLRPVLGQLEDFGRSFNPIIDYLGHYKREIVSFFALDASATQATDAPPSARGQRVHYLRTSNPVNPEALAMYPRRISTNRSNPYSEPGAYDRIGRPGLQVFGTYLCTSNPVPTLVPPSALPAELQPFLPQELYDDVQQFFFAGATGDAVPAPPCIEQAPLGRLVGQDGKYPQLLRAPAREP
jgi:phospholipid/cholesterol/gamma-HCH transport system substrate-binding protein